MLINQKHFYEWNFADFVHIKYLKHFMRDVAAVVSDTIDDHKSIDKIQFKTDKNNEQELHVIYTDWDNQQHDTLIKPAITDRVNELIDKRFRWIADGAAAIKKLELKDHYIKVTTDDVQADFIIPYIKDKGLEQSELETSGDDDFITIKLTNRTTADVITYNFPTQNNFQALKSDFNDFKNLMEKWQTEVNQHLQDIDQKDQDQDKRLDAVEQKNTDQDKRLDDHDQTNTRQDKDIKDLQDHSDDMQKVIDILEDKSHNFLTQLENPADFNSIEKDGNYFVYAQDTDDNQLTGNNRPSDHWGILYNYLHEPSNQIQIYISDTDNDLFVRFKNSSGWSKWESTTTGAELSAALEKLVDNLNLDQLKANLEDVTKQVEKANNDLASQKETTDKLSNALDSQKEETAKSIEDINSNKENIDKLAQQLAESGALPVITAKMDSQKAINIFNSVKVNNLFIAEAKFINEYLDFSMDNELAGYVLFIKLNSTNANSVNNFLEIDNTFLTINTIVLQLMVLNNNLHVNNISALVTNVGETISYFNELEKITGKLGTKNIETNIYEYKVVDRLTAISSAYNLPNIFIKFDFPLSKYNDDVEFTTSKLLTSLNDLLKKDIILMSEKNNIITLKYDKTDDFNNFYTIESPTFDGTPYTGRIF